MKAYNSEDDVIQNLKDAGCTNKQIQEIMELYKSGKKDIVCKALESHRKCVVDNVHKNEKQIDCIDYFIYQMKKENKGG